MNAHSHGYVSRTFVVLVCFIFSFSTLVPDIYAQDAETEEMPIDYDYSTAGGDQEALVYIVIGMFVLAAIGGLFSVRKQRKASEKLVEEPRVEPSIVLMDLSMDPDSVSGTGCCPEQEVGDLANAGVGIVFRF